MKFIPFMFALAVAGSAQADQSPYAGEDERSIKALSPEQVRGYLEGAGMGYAKAAELNRYPGPKHVLELADELDLGANQLRATRALFASMQAEASRLGKELVELEGELDLQFASGTITPERLEDLTRAIAAVEGRIRHTHLKAHLDQKALLNAEQVSRYDGLRGYRHGHHHRGH